MPWLETAPTEQRERFIADHRRALYSMSELCDRTALAGRPATSGWSVAFTAFRSEFNNERPHSALGGNPPASRYAASPCPFPDRLPPLEYPGHFIVKRVTNAGTFRLKHKLLFNANALKQHHIGLEEINDGIWSIYFGTVLLGRVDEREMRIYG